jgi:hypothetical protein
LVVIYSVTINKAIRIFRSEAEVTKMCTPGDDTVLICGTNLGSLIVFDF